MGLCGSKGGMTAAEKARERADKERSRRVEQQMQGDQQQESLVNKLLLLGAGESGKSTLFKQMVTIYGKGFPEKERRTYTPVVYNNIITSMKTLVEQSHRFGGGAESSGKVARSMKILDELKGDEEIDEVIGRHIKRLWKSDSIQRTFGQRSNFQLPDSTNYFMGRISDVMQAGYIPSEQDVLRSRVRTTGIVENEFVIDGNHFKMFDVGGQRNERKKWIHCFENVTAVLFVAAISEYDQVLYEDENTNRIVEALNLFEEIANSRWFKNTSIILFLNKRDLFEKKIQNVSLRVCFPEYDGEDAYHPAIAYLRQRFEERNRTGKKLYTHVCCATDTDNVRIIFDTVKEIIIRGSLGEGGFDLM